ncbi:hypothetical protein JVU11DRAFT_12470 [Chiua virens]|nr:hypothetical protein JVU11DRAFT_12470 [Chiua virens]
MSIRFAVTDAIFSHYPFVPFSLSSGSLLIPVGTYSMLDRSRCFMSVSTLAPDDKFRRSQSYSKLTTIHSQLAANIADEVCKADCTNINEEIFRKSKEKILRVLHLSKRLGIKSGSQLTRLTHSVLNDGNKKFHSTLATIHHEIAMQANPSTKSTVIDRRSIWEILRESRNEVSLASDPDFTADLEHLKSTMPALQDAIAAARDQAQEYLESIVDKICRVLFDSLPCIQQEGMQEQPNFEVDYPMKQDLCVGRSLILMVNSQSQLCGSL